MTIHPFDGHYLVLTWAEDPDNPTWPSTQEYPFDWAVSHPPTCKMEEIGNESGSYWRHTCFYEHDVENIGVEAFEGISERCRPVIIPLEWVVETSVGFEGSETDLYIQEGDVPVNWMPPPAHEWWTR